MHLFLSWLLPPLAGALIGFLLGSLLLGRVARSALIQSRLSIARAAGGQAGSLGSGIMAMSAASVVPAEGTEQARRLEDALRGILGGILGSRGTIYAVRDAVSGLVGGLATRGVGETARKLGLEALLSDKALPALASERSRAGISASAGSLVSEQAGTALDEEVIRSLADVVDSAAPDAAEAVVRWLKSADTRAYLSERGHDLLPRILSRLTDLQKLFLTAGQFDRRLDEKMPEIVDETVAALEKMVRDPRQQQRIVGVFSDAARRWGGSLERVQTGETEDRRRKLSKAATRLVGRFLRGLGEPSRRRELARKAAEALDRDHRTLGGFFRDSFGLSEQDVVEVVSDRLLRAITGPDAARSLASRLTALLISQAREDPQRTLASALGLDDARRRELDDLLRNAVSRAVEGAVPRVLGVPAVRRKLDLALGGFGAAAGLAAGAAAAVLRALGW